MTKKIKEKKCDKCRYYTDNQCTHPTNYGIAIKYKIEKPIFIKKTEELQKTCKNYAKI